MKSSSARLLWPACLLAAVLFLTGCVGVIPRPVSSKVECGQKLTPAEVAFIEPGVTTRGEVSAGLGTNCIALPLDRAIAYSWEMKGGGGVWWVCVVVPYGAVADGGTWTGGWRAFFVAFDNDGRVTATAFKRLSPRRSLHEHLYDWVDALPDRTAIAPSQ